ncbi:MAG: DNA translocase FtsK 4TM domain-containing protein [Alphaproteobacteria bacterium]|nr:DNA translocase FtsK 4TM domain-containing protein [Alphaproteobacteria bacterium]
MNQKIIKNRSNAAFVNIATQKIIYDKIIEGFALLIIIASLLTLIALFSFQSDDPSLNRTATASLIKNFIGPPGAILADVILQSIGLGGIFFCIILLAWGWKIILHQKISWFWVKISLIPLGLACFSLGLTELNIKSSWLAQLGCGEGGCLGWLIHQYVSPLILVYLNGNQFLLTSISLILGIILLLYSSSIPWGFYQKSFLYLRIIAKLFLNLVRFIYRSFLKLFLLRKIKDPEIDTYNYVEKAIPIKQKEIKKTSSFTEKFLKKKKDPLESIEKNMISQEYDDVYVPKTKSPSKSKPKLKQSKLNFDEKSSYYIPPIDLLDDFYSRNEDIVYDEEALENNARLLETVLDDFGIKGKVVNVRPGPVITLYELEPSPGTKTSRIINLSDDVARSMSAVSVRIAVIAGRNVIGIELPNQKREKVSLRQLLETPAYQKTTNQLALALGKDIGGVPVIVDLARMPHLLIAGTTGSGKSVAVNTMILSLLFRLSPDECKFIMIDPKMLELSVYDGIPHLLSPVVTDPRKAIVALKWTVREMENRYRAMSKLGVRNIEGYNQRITDAQKKGETLNRKIQVGFDPETGNPIYEEEVFDLTVLPFIVVVVDEMADLMLVAGKEIESAIQRLAQMARAAGIHIIMATQRPSVDVITGTIKANFPTRISFHVTSKIDSRTILGEMGAEQLLGQGDMLYMAQGGRITRIHGPFVTDLEVEKIVYFLKNQGEPKYIEEITQEKDDLASFNDENNGQEDEFYNRAVDLVYREGKASTSFIQRHLQIGYNRAARIIEKMEKAGIVSAANHVGKREVLNK